MNAQTQSRTSFISRLRRRLSDQDTERGAVLMIVALVITVLMLCAGFAVDFGSWYARAEKLQNAADAAALAGAAEFELYTVADSNGDRTSGQPTEEARGKAQARVLDVLAQNGIVNDATTEIIVSFPLELDNQLGEVSVRVIDRDVDLYFSTFVIDNFTLQRVAKAQVDKCGNQCSNTIAIPEPFAKLEATGSGDGFVPIYIDKRMYSINHHIFNPNIVCVTIDAPQQACDNDGDPNVDSSGTASAYPLRTEEIAESPQFARNFGTSSNDCTSDGVAGDYQPTDCYPVSANYDAAVTDNVVLHAVAGTRIFFTAQHSDRISLFCWETDTNPRPEYDPIGAPCPNSPETISRLPRVNFNKLREGRGGSVTFVPSTGSTSEGRIFVFTDDHRVHCRQSTDISSPCVGYETDVLPASGADGIPDGVPSPLADDNAPALGTASQGTWGLADRIFDEQTGRIYTTVHFGTGSTTSSWGVRLICWDTQADDACADFSSGGGGSGSKSVEIHLNTDKDFADGGSTLFAGRLFFDRNAAGEPTRVCSTGYAGNYWSQYLDTHCVNMDGAGRTKFTAFDTASNPTGSGTQFGNQASLTGAGEHFRGTHHYHALSNRLIVNGGYSRPTPTHCWSFGDGTTGPGYCGGISSPSSGLDGQDYGVTSLGSCIFALGHNNVFYTFTSDFTEGCNEGRASTEIFPCICYNGDQHWGSVTVQAPDFTSETGPYIDFLVYVKANEFDAEADALLTRQLVGTDGVLDLDTISADYPKLFIEIVVRTKSGATPWDDPLTQPRVTVGYSDKPFLVN